MLDTDTAREYVALMQRKKALEAEVGEIQGKLQALEEPLMRAMVDEGVESLPVTTDAGRMTIYVHRQIWAKSRGDREACCAALESAGLGDFVTQNFNTHTISAYFRELLKDGGEIPPEILGAFNLNEFTTLRARQSNSAPSASSVASQNLKTQTQRHNNG